MRDTGPGHPKSRKGQMLDSLEERRKKGSSPTSASLAGLGAAEWVGDLQLVCQARLPSSAWMRASRCWASCRSVKDRWLDAGTSGRALAHDWVDLAPGS